MERWHEVPAGVWQLNGHYKKYNNENIYFLVNIKLDFGLYSIVLNEEFAPITRGRLLGSVYRGNSKIETIRSLDEIYNFTNKHGLPPITEFSPDVTIRIDPLFAPTFPARHGSMVQTGDPNDRTPLKNLVLEKIMNITEIPDNLFRNAAFSPDGGRRRRRRSHRRKSPRSRRNSSR